MKTMLLTIALLLTANAFADTFVAVGYGGRRMVSGDGKTWDITAQWAKNGGDDSNNLMGIAYGLGKLVAVACAAGKRGDDWLLRVQVAEIEALLNWC